MGKEIEKINKDDFGIFQNQEAVVENIKKSAEAVGIKVDENTVDKLKDGQPFEVSIAKTNCKWCYGRGTVNFVPNKSKSFLLKYDPLSSGPSPIEGDGNTRLPEEFKDKEWREKNMVKATCKCVRRRLE